MDKKSIKKIPAMRFMYIVQVCAFQPKHFPCDEVWHIWPNYFEYAEDYHLRKKF